MVQPNASPTSNQMAADRVWMAHERTLMAWIRTATSMISFGFTIYKFFEGRCSRLGVRRFRPGSSLVAGRLVLRTGEPTHFSISSRYQPLEVVSMDMLPIPIVATRPGTRSDASRPARWNWIPWNVAPGHRSHRLRRLRSDWIDVAGPDPRSRSASSELQNRCNRVALDHARHCDGAARPFHSEAWTSSSSRHTAVRNARSISQCRFS